jgi:hypothetical protein
MTLSRDERAARGAQTRAERMAQRQQTTDKRPWLLPLLIAIAMAVLVGAVVVTWALGIQF